MLNKVKYNLGSGNDTKIDYINLDLKELDLNSKEWNLKPADEIYARFVLEHLEDVNNFMFQCHKTLKKGGKLVIIVPYYNCSGAYRVDHLHFFTKDWFKFFLRNKDKRITSLYGFDGFDLIEQKINYLSCLFWIPEKIKYFLSMFIHNIAQNIEVKLRK